MPHSTCTKCPTLIPLGQSRCAKHPAKASTNQRGYGAEHQRAKRELAKQLKANNGGKCYRCRGYIGPNDEFHADHVPGGWSASHPKCNTAAGGRNK